LERPQREVVMETKTDKDRNIILNINLRDKLKEFLRELSARGSDLHIWSNRSPLFVYRRFCDIMDDFGATRPADNEFYSVLKRVKKAASRDEEDAIDILLSAAQARDKPLAKTVKPSKGVWRVRNPEYGELAWLDNIVTEIDTKGYANIDLFPLIEKKSYLLHKYSPEREEQSDYLDEFFVFGPGDTKVRTAINDLVLLYINLLKPGLDYHCLHLFRVYPTDKVKYWFVDAFRQYSVRFLKDWAQYKRPARYMPNFEKKHDLLARFLNGETPKQLGYKRSTYHHFTHEVVPQGIIGFLFYMYYLLYYESDGEWIRLKDKADAMSDILKDVPERRIPQVLDILKTAYPSIYALESELYEPLKNSPF
jgi:hypothetical protein